VKRDTVIKHKEIIVICEKSEMVIGNKNYLLTQLDSKSTTQSIVSYTITNQPLTCSKCGKIGHAKEICHNKKREEHVIHVVHIKVVELVSKVTTQLIKPIKVPLKYPCVIYFSFEHHAPDCPRNTKIQNMFQTKPTTIATIM